MNAFTYVLIFLVVGGFADLEFGNSEESNKLQQLLYEITKSNVSVGQILLPGSNQTIYLTINNFFLNSTGSKTKKLGDDCVDNSECSSIPYSVCSSANCSCSDNYFVKNGTCIGLLDESCKEDSDCGVSNSSCQSGICKCRSGFNSTDNKICFQYATEYETPVASARACDLLEDAVYLEGKCYKKKQLHESCKISEECAVSFSECSNGECKCKNEYAEHKNRCYAPWSKGCNIPEDCSTIWLDCISGTCRDAHFWNKGELSSKPGATARWSDYKYYYIGWYANPYFTASTSHDVGDEGNLAWVKNYTLDRVVAFNNFNPLVIRCRASNAAGYFVPGKVKFSENNKLCQIDHQGQKFSTEDYEVYVDLGPEN